MGLNCCAIQGRGEDHVWNVGTCNFYNLHSNADSFRSMNEPHDVPDIVKWADTVQQAVTAIRKAG